ncbi:unnamed protein product [Euphydryas editha]|uniref:Uncharacterized protein n=1 Tax=Euphydryas editha TaxID=104508 RepID=A0AAU9UNU4_EUPED|nr:unnamed protein product [Euphydryas editha]
MRPLFPRNKMKNKIHKKKFSQKIFKFCGCPGIPRSDLDDINEILHNSKLRLSRGQGSWKVMPKDSCEVYKERRRRQAERNERSNDVENTSQITSKSEKKTAKKDRARKAKHKYRPGQRRRHRKQSSPCSCYSSRTSCTCSTGTET